MNNIVQNTNLQTNLVCRLSTLIRMLTCKYSITSKKTNLQQKFAQLRWKHKKYHILIRGQEDQG